MDILSDPITYIYSQFNQFHALCIMHTVVCKQINHKGIFWTGEMHEILFYISLYSN